MAEESDKEKKLKEIQARLAEIQGKSTSSKKDDAPKKEEVKPTPKAEPKKEEAAKAEPEKAPSKSQPEKKAVEKAKPAAKKSTPPPPPPKTEKKKEESKSGTDWNQNKVKADKASKATKPAEIKADKKAPSRTRFKILSIISISITLLVAAYIVYEFVLKDDQPEVIEAAVPESTEDVVADDVVKDAMAGADQEEESDEVVEENQETVEATPEKEESKQSERTSARTENEASPSATPAVAKSSPPSGFIISYSSNGNAQAAASNASMLNNKGFNSGYYYMPDKNPSSPALYKVYVGPYDSESAAFPDFKKVIKLNDKAFILRMN